MTRAWTGEPSTTTVVDMERHDDTGGRPETAWTRFLTGTAIVVAFTFVTTAVIASYGGWKAARIYGLALLAATLAATTIDGIAARRRHRRRNGR